MKIIESNGNLIISNVSDFELDDIFDCGQCFRWNKAGNNSYIGTAFGKTLLIEKKEDELVFHNTTRSDFDEIWYNYFDFGRNYTELKSILSQDPILKNAVCYGSGIRILHQDTFETLISFIISASNNIPRIKGIIERLCENFGKPHEYMGQIYYSFPSADDIAALNLEDLAVIRAGFRDKYILAAARAVSSNDISLCALYDMSVKDAKDALMHLPGVGNKVSDCILLFGLGKYSSFPIDVWVKRIMEYCYFDSIPQSISTISDYADKHFGVLGGFAQQYLFFWARENKIGTKA